MKVPYFVINNLMGPNSAQEMLHLNSCIILHDAGSPHAHLCACVLGREACFPEPGPHQSFRAPQMNAKEGGWNTHGTHLPSS